MQPWLLRGERLGISRATLQQWVVAESFLRVLSRYSVKKTHEEGYIRLTVIGDMV